MRILLAWLTLLAALLPANAWLVSRDTTYNMATPPPSGCSPACPGDLALSSISSWVSWTSTGRCFKFAFSGPILDLADKATGTTTGTRLNCASGVVSEDTGTNCSWVTTTHQCSPKTSTCSTACEIVTLYDQSGGPAGNFTMPHLSAPLMLLNALNSTPCIIVPTTSVNMNSANTITLAQAFTMSLVAKENGVGGGVMTMMGNANNTIRDGFDNTAAPNNKHAIYSGNLFPTQAQFNGNWHAFNDVFNGASSVLSTDGTILGSQNLNNSNGFSASNVRLVAGLDPAFLAWGCEFGLANGNMSPTDIGTLQANQHAAYGSW